MMLQNLSYILICFFFLGSTAAATAQQPPRDISFTIVDKPPRFPNCKGENTDFLKECFRNNVEKLIADNFNFEQFETILFKGKHRVFVTFRILVDGTYDQLHIRTPYQSVERETIKALKDLPMFDPAIHKEQPRNVLFATAFTIEVEKGRIVEKTEKL